jgi:hypothetical protein
MTIRLGLMILLAAFLAACATSEVDKAFGGKLEPFKETTAIVDYCQGCHVHRKFNPSSHMAEKPFQYKTLPYSAAGDCKTCHEIKRNVWSDVVTVTHFPSGAIVESK